ncbi:MAG: pyrroline-5-carboxylate reductase [Acidobacteriota bacterium]
MLHDKTITVIGLGKLGESLVRGLLDAEALPASSLAATARTEATLQRKDDLPVKTGTDNAAACAGADLVLLAVKPQVIAGVLDSIRDALPPDAIVVSTAAGVTLADLEAGLPADQPVVRTMPNTPSLVRSGMTVLAPGAAATEQHLALAGAVFEAVGRTMVLEEKHLDAVTGLSGSGPAFMYVVLEALAEGGLKVGLPRHVATELVAQTMLGAARLALETGEHPAKLKDAVTTPAGCTIDGLLELEAGGLRVALIQAVVNATRRAGELG